MATSGDSRWCSTSSQLRWAHSCGQRPTLYVVGRTRCQGKAAWQWAKKLYTIRWRYLENEEIPSSQRKWNVESHLLRPSPGDRYFIVDAGASMHMMSKVEMDTRIHWTPSECLGLPTTCDHGECVDRHFRGGHSLRESFGPVPHCPTSRRHSSSVHL